MRFGMWYYSFTGGVTMTSELTAAVAALVAAQDAEQRVERAAREAYVSFFNAGEREAREARLARLAWDDSAMRVRTIARAVEDLTRAGAAMPR